ncbi:hypothetical protein N7533_008937 [Penicillium manginii]|uniref:uncharacterized protein n=1 Tax=Penicillium manginii TaxID=203109 RepID=UPI0025472779|nr:uncharacterized protein N7533_008937 [Penicillium manginii]KAJ5744067.1 hypothetical protein N7533_008937 [Penicillium manginii]
MYRARLLTPFAANSNDPSTKRSRSEEYRKVIIPGHRVAKHHARTENPPLEPSFKHDPPNDVAPIFNQ